MKRVITGGTVDNAKEGRMHRDPALMPVQLHRRPDAICLRFGKDRIVIAVYLKQRPAGLGGVVQQQLTLVNGQPAYQLAQGITIPVNILFVIFCLLWYNRLQQSIYFKEVIWNV